MSPSRQSASPRSVEGWVNYIGEMEQRPRYYANDHSRDVLELDPHRMAAEDARRGAP